MAVRPKKQNLEGIPPKVVKVEEEHYCELTDAEWRDRARDLAEANKELFRQEARKKSVTKQLTNDVEIAKAKQSKLADIVSTKSEQREIVVEVKYDYELGTVTKTRTDTKELISERDMTTDERQAELDLIDANKFIEGRHQGEGDDKLEEETAGEPASEEASEQSS